MESLAGKLFTPLRLISYLYDNCFVAILGDREYLQKNMAENLCLQNIRSIVPTLRDRI
jgi:hypothetical protein